MVTNPDSLDFDVIMIDFGLSKTLDKDKSKVLSDIRGILQN